MTGDAAPRARLLRLGALSGMAAVVWDIVVLSALTVLSSVDPVHDYLSVIGLGAWGGSYRVAATVAVALHVPFAAALWQAWPGRLGATMAMMMTSFFVVQWLGAVVFPCDPGCANITATGYTHYILGILGFVMLGLSVIGYGVHFGAQGAYHHGIRWATIVAVALALALLAADIARTLHGLLERLSLLAFGAWTILIGLRLLHDAQSLNGDGAVDDGAGSRTAP